MLSLRNGAHAKVLSAGLARGVAVAVAFVLVGCAGGADSSVDIPSTSSLPAETVGAEADADAEAAESQDLSSPTTTVGPAAREDEQEGETSFPEPTLSNLDAGEEGATSEPGVLDPVETEGRDLALDDLFDPDNRIKEDLYDIATAYEQKGLGVVVRGGDEVTFELRLGNRYDKLTFNAGQANNSESSDLIMRVEVHRNGDSDAAENISFNETEPFEVAVANVNALKIVISCRDSERGEYYGSDSITAVLYGLRLE